MGPLEGPHKREKVKQYLTRELRGHEVGPYLVARRSGKNALMGPLEGPMAALTGTHRVSIGSLLSQAHRGLSKGPSAPLGAPNGALIGAPWVL
jgi:hypothetical protein